MQEEIQIQGESKRTIVKYFTSYSGQTSEDGSVFYAISDLSGTPVKLTESALETQYYLDSQNNNLEINQITSQYAIYSGTVIESEVNVSYTQQQKNDISDFYVQSILRQANLTYPQNSPPSDVYSAVFFEEYPFNDYFLNVKINRSMNTLDTLNIYNVTNGVLPKYNNDTGVLFGKLEALQVLSDENKEKIRIPLKNVVVGIFNPSEKFPSIASLDEEGNRIRLNLYETLPTINNPYNLRGYSSFQSYLTDLNYSKNDGGLDEIPDEYKYVTITDENGNFVLHNVPVGQQTLMVEVDLLKFGLEPEEVALNFFPYPTQDDPNVSTLPHLFFGQYPINIVPSWGDFQTGYTEMKLSIALDLRKWVTYYTFPISANVGVNAKKPRALEQLYSEGIFSPLRVFIRDMTKEFVENNPPKVELVKIPDIYDKNIDLYNSWNNEFKVKNNKIEFETSNFNAFKLPANLYHPDGINTKGEKGVWLAAYQIKIAYPDQSVSFQVTGFDEQFPSDGVIANVNHYDFTNYEDWYQDYLQSNTIKPGIGRFPYEKPWSLTYPETYIITKKPSVLNPYKQWDSNGEPILNVSGYTINKYKEPKYLDGDLVGANDSWGTNANGYGLQSYDPEIWGNQFAREVTKNEVWCYEDVRFWAWEFSNGYSPVFDGDWSKYSSLPGIPWGGKPRVYGERYQRVEAGYAYWLRPRGWPRIDASQAWGDTLLYTDHSANARDRSASNVYPGYFSYYDATYKYIDEVTLIMGAKSPWYSKKGQLTIYRVEKPYYNLPKKPPFNETFVTLNFGVLLMDGEQEESSKKHDRSLTDLGIGRLNRKEFFYAVNLPLAIENLGSIPVTINAGGVSKTLEVAGAVGSYYVFENLLYGNFTELVLPGNSSYNPNSNTYERAAYRLKFISKGGGTIWGQPNSDHEWGYIQWPRINGRSDQYPFLDLFYDFDGKQGLPAYTEDDPRGYYYYTQTNGFPIDIVWNNFTNYIRFSSEDASRLRSYYNSAGDSRWGFIRMHGVLYQVDHQKNAGWGCMPSGRVKWTNTDPKKSYCKSETGGNWYFRLLTMGLWNNTSNDIDFRNTP